MPRFPAHTTDNAPEASRETLDARTGETIGRPAALLVSYGMVTAW